MLNILTQQNRSQLKRQYEYSDYPVERRAVRHQRCCRRLPIALISAFNSFI